MKKQLLILKLVCCLFFGHLYAQCPQGNVILTNQTQINNFALNYPNCTEIMGNLEIGTQTPSYSDITSLLPLGNLTSVQGILTIKNNLNLNSLAGLNNITTVGHLNISNQFSTQLTSLSGLEGLTTVNETVTIAYNSGLTTLTGLDNLQTIGSYLSIDQLPALNSISSLNNLTYVGNGIRIEWASILTSLNAFQNLINCSTEFRINNTGLTSITNLTNLQTTFLISLFNNNNLTEISGLQNINPANLKKLNISSNPLLTFCNLPNFCTYLANDAITSPRTIIGNAGNCLNEVAVVNTCQSLEIEIPETSKDLIVYSQNKVLNIVSDGFEMNTLEITDALGRIIYSNIVKGNHQLIADLSENQLLFIKVSSTDGRFYLKKIMN